jgi:HD-like signal output (HDOD) protein
MLKMQSLFNQIDNIPQVPEIVRILISQASDDNIDFKPIAATVAKEQIISVKLLRAVNSAHYSLTNRVGSVKQALVIIGMDEFKKLIIVSGLVSAVDEIPGIDLNDFWLDNFRTATYAKWLANHADLNDSDMIFTAGLISSLGKILIHLADEIKATKINDHVKAGISRPDSERNILGFTHQQVAAEFCHIWQFPEQLIKTVTQAGEPFNFADPYSAACAVYIGRYISESSYSNKEHQAILDEFPVKEWQQLGLKKEDIADKMATLLALNTGLEGVLD